MEETLELLINDVKNSISVVEPPKKDIEFQQMFQSKFQEWKKKSNTGTNSTEWMNLIESDIKRPVSVAVSKYR